MRLAGHCNCSGVKYECDEQPQITAVCPARLASVRQGPNLTFVVGEGLCASCRGRNPSNLTHQG